MECVIGEIRKIGSKWLQCIEGTCNKECYFYNRSLHKTIAGINGNDFGACNACFRSDNKSVIFKELEKIGGHYDDCGTILQRFKIYTNVTNADTKGLELHIYSNDTIGIQIKQAKEDMEENKLNLKPFDIQKAREGKPVCTRDGRKARIVCFDRKANTPIVALIECDDRGEILQCVHNDGRCVHFDTSDNDLMMLPEKKEGWVNVYRDCDGVNITENDNIYSSEEAAIASAQIINKDGYVATTKIIWEE